MAKMDVAFKATRNYAREMDDADQLSDYRQRFIIPKHKGRDVIYFCGNSLGLQPKAVQEKVEEELADWARFGVEGHFQAKRPWFGYHHFFTESLSRLVGARANEVVAMNTLTVNLHLLMISFYRPEKKRYKIIMEAGAFPSDMYAVETQVRMHGFDPDDAIVEIAPRKGEHTLRASDIEDTIRLHGNKVALVLMGGVNYYTGQYFDLESITRTAHEVGALAGFDLAHAVGNKVLHLHDWNVDFACWCSYKYLNSGPGAVGGIYVHDRWVKSNTTFRLGGWWGHDEKTRFKMKKGFKPMKSAESWQMSNAQVMNMVAHRASLDIFDEVRMNDLADKSLHLTAYAETLLKQISHLKFDIITPSDPLERGCQLSLLFRSRGREVFEHLQQHGVVADWREPNVIRIAPVPLYNTFQDVYGFYEILMKLR
ncbi:MAG TPA: kynureninase [Chitinophagaceae bacterium]|nr:kynureninase [Chitinophagaceae bacterium]HNF71453.1 kynureninase [Chitinophagaceae bacterium]